MNGDRGDIVLGWLTKVTLTLAVLGVVAFDGVSLGVSRLEAVEDADKAARAAASAWKSSKDVQRAYDAAAASVDPGDTVLTEGFLIDTDGKVTLQLRTVSNTLVVEKIGPISEWGTVTATGTGGPPL